MKKEVIITIVLISLIIFMSPDVTGNFSWKNIFQKSSLIKYSTSQGPAAPTSYKQPTYPLPIAPTPIPTYPTIPTAPTSPTTSAQPTAPTCTPTIESSLALNCNDGKDNDCDGLVDGQDPTSCPTACGKTCGIFGPYCPSGFTCKTNILGTGLCAATFCPENQPTTCFDFVDNDLDNSVDCADSSCLGIGACSVEFFTSSPTPQGYCHDGFDNDKDGAIDCADQDCANACVEDNFNYCRNGLDDDNDGLIDANEPACAIWWSENYGGNCANWIDDDNDGLTDCADTTDCGNNPLCAEGKSVGVTGRCLDGFDNDQDGTVDCADQDCINSGICKEKGNCADGFDNDGDNLWDCLDLQDCSNSPACKCVETDGGNIFQAGSITLGGLPVRDSMDVCGVGPGMQIYLEERSCPVASVHQIKKVFVGSGISAMNPLPTSTLVTCATTCNSGKC